MSTLTRKQREIQQRELHLIEVSRKLLLEHGYAGLTMDQLTAETEFSKGVIYQHFKSKEDLITAIAVQTLHERVERFTRAMTFQGRPRERMLAIGVAEELFVRLNPQHFHSERIIKMASLNERVSAERLEALHREEGSCFGRVLSIVNEAIEQGDLKLEPAQHPSDVVLGLWSLNEGCYGILAQSMEMLQHHGVVTPFASLRRNCHSLLDGYNWLPLRKDWDYEQTYARILREIFPDECLKAGIG